MGLLLGPRGNFLEELKAKTKCNIIIRGKGSLKSGMTGINKDGKRHNFKPIVVKKIDLLGTPLQVKSLKPWTSLCTPLSRATPRRTSRTGPRRSRS